MKAEASSRLRYPAYVAEVGTEEFRPKLVAGVFTGYGTAISLLAIGLVARHLEVLPGGDSVFVLIAIKLTTNTLAFAAWRSRKLVVELSALNIFADVVVLTGAVYYTGGILSPLVSLYFIEVAVMALLTNVGLTMTVVLGCFLSYAAMVLMVHTGLLPVTEPLAHDASEVGTALVVIALAVFAISTFAPGVYVALIVDQLRRNERALAARAAELVEAGRTKSEFTANITHELRTPLHGILGMGELLEEQVYGPMTTEQLEAVKTMRSSANGLLELIDSLLVLARAEALRLEVSVGPVDLAEVVSSVVATGRMVVGNRALDLGVSLPTELPTVRTDRQKLVQILVNVLANAIKFTPDEGSVQVEAVVEERGVRIAVKDTGRGIPETQLATIFQPYVQGDGSPIREHGGAGIGLSVVRTLSDLLGIELVVESKVGSGSTFTLHVPLEPPARDAA